MTSLSICWTNYQRTPILESNGVEGLKAYLPRAGQGEGADLSEVPPFIQRIRRDERGGLAGLLLSHVLTAERADVNGLLRISLLHRSSI